MAWEIMVEVLLNGNSYTGRFIQYFKFNYGIGAYQTADQLERAPHVIKRAMRQENALQPRPKIYAKRD
ncbi:hypothetical protein LOCC1_G004726 [Lachnellula occidentalis]|uniref:Uncharacterized protein n=1 Tax=Lachnellula occidentalis TaxID=215460 RepID=A0A8H8RWN1_9HELO|nr:hypothetical protein LOCC1_G004726 [Lachnellula occidentalis]